MKIGFIGAGKVGFSLGKFLSAGGVPVTGYYSRHRESAMEASAFVAAKCYDTPEALLADSDAVFLTVPDGAIPSVFQSVCPDDPAGTIFCHCSGAMTAEAAFPGLAQRGGFGYSIHPLLPVSSRYESYREFRGAFFCIEGCGPHIPLWTEMLESLGARVQVIPAESKMRYHAACAISSNLVCALVEESLELLERCGFTRTRALEALTPLLRSNLEHLLTDGPVNALTGPVERGDAETVAGHLACLPNAAERDMYRSVSRKLTELAMQKHPDRDYRPVLHILQNQ